MRTYLLAFVLLVTSTFLSPANAASPLDAAKGMVGDDAFALVHVDMATFDFDMAMKTVASMYGNPRELAAMQDRTKQIIDSLKMQGMKSMLFVAAMQDIGNGPYLLADFDGAPKDAAAVEKLFRDFASEALMAPDDFLKQEVVEKIVFFGSKRTIARLKEAPAKLSAVRTAQIDAAFRAAGNSGLRLAFVPTKDTRVAFEQMAPPFPPALAKYNMKDLLEGAQWAALGAETKGGPNVKLTLQSKGEKEALKMAELISASSDMMSDEVVRHNGAKALEELVKVRKILTPKRDVDQLIAHLTPKDFEAIQKLVVAPMAEKAQQTNVLNKLKMIALAMLNFESAYRAYPPHASYDDKGQPLLSWRVHILPFTEDLELYKKFRLNEPWDSAHNRKLIAEMPVFFRSSSNDVEPGKTTFLVPYGNGTVFFGKAGTKIQRITDGTSRTILCVDVAPEHAVIWTKHESSDPKIRLESRSDKAL